MPEAGTYLNVSERQHTHGNGALLVVSYRDEIARIGHHAHYLSLPDAFVHLLDGTGEDPRMEAAEAFFLTLAEFDLLVHFL